MSDAAQSEMYEIAEQWRDLAHDIEALQPPAERVRTSRFHQLHIELALAVLSGALCVATVAAPRWIELVSGLDPDYGSGRFEWTTVAVTMGAAVVAALAARQHRRRRLDERGR